MERTALATTGGMIFDLHGSRRVKMWMHDTRIAMDMVFVSSEGTVVAILSDEQSMSDEFISVGAPVAAVIELNAGTAQAIGLLCWGQGSASAFFDRGPVGAGGGRAGAARIAASRASD